VKPVITAEQAVERLTDYNVTTAISKGHVRQAIAMVDQSGARWDESSGAPDEVLDATALLAHYVGRGEQPAVVSERVLDASATYAAPVKDPHYLAAERLLAPYGGELVSRLV